ncbi:MAG: T9SS type A sorting domain-containing protein [Ferruginibacter sp.]
MKKLSLLISFAFYGIIASAQVTQQVTQQSPNIVKTAYLTNLNGKIMQAYPNPATDHVIIQHHSSAERAVISLVSTDGQIMEQRTVLPNTLQTELNIGRLNKGIYILKFDDGRGDVRTLKLVKN